MGALCPTTRFCGATSSSIPPRMGRRRKAGRRQPNGRLQHRDDPGRPTRERLNHGVVARLERPIADDDGHPVQPYRAATFLSQLEAQGLIDKATLIAGEAFRAQFYKASFDSLGAAAMVRSSRSTAGSAPTARIEHARHAVWQAICAVGGLASLNGSCLWHVVGWESDLALWVLEQGWVGRRISVEMGRSILLEALAALKEHYS